MGLGYLLRAAETIVAAICAFLLLRRQRESA
jgi:hypothetical protein